MTFNETSSIYSCLYLIILRYCMPRHFALMSINEQLSRFFLLYWLLVYKVALKLNGKAFFTEQFERLGSKVEAIKTEGSMEGSPKITSQCNVRTLHFPEDANGPVCLEYIALDHTRLNTLTKTYIIDEEPRTTKDCPLGNKIVKCSLKADYSYTELALVPVAMYRDPFRKGSHKIVLCELQYPDGKFPEINSRMACREFIEKVKDEEPWLGFEQEFIFLDENGDPCDLEQIKKNPDLDTDCQLFMSKHAGMQRELTDLHLRSCIYAGLNMYGMTRECTPSQWEYQLAPLPAVEAGDQLIVSRYILVRIAEMYCLQATFSNPECLRNTKIRSVLHTNFSTKKMREDGGIKHIYQALETIAGHNQDNIMKYYDLEEGNDYKWRLSGEQYMPKYDNLVIKVGYKWDTTLRIPTRVAQEGKGYFEERRPSGEANPYEVARALISAALLKSNGF